MNRNLHEFAGRFWALKDDAGRVIARNGKTVLYSEPSQANAVAKRYDCGAGPVQVWAEHLGPTPAPKDAELPPGKFLDIIEYISQKAMDTCHALELRIRQGAIPDSALAHSLVEIYQAHERAIHLTECMLFLHSITVNPKVPGR